MYRYGLGQLHMNGPAQNSLEIYRFEIVLMKRAVYPLQQHTNGYYYILESLTCNRRSQWAWILTVTARLESCIRVDK